MTYLTVRRTLPSAAAADGSNTMGIAHTMGEQVVMDFMQWAVLQGAGYEVRAGTITTPLVGDVAITDTAAEYCIDVNSGYTVLPMANNIAVRLGTGTLHEYAVKQVATASTVGTAYVPLPIIMGGAACNTTARVAAAGGVTVTAELATTTRRHWAWSNPVAAGAGNDLIVPDWRPNPAPPIKGGSNGTCLYVQIAATTTGPSYYATLTICEFTSAALF